jgi:hypothetical protein
LRGEISNTHLPRQYEPRYALKLAVELWALSAPVDEQNEGMFIDYVVSNLKLEACLIKK